MRDPTWKVVDIKWWHKPIPLWSGTGPEARQVGWVWNQRAYIVKNIHAGWVAFVGDQTPENLDVWFCSHCGGSLWLSQRIKIEEFLEARK